MHKAAFSHLLCTMACASLEHNTTFPLTQRDISKIGPLYYNFFSFLPRVYTNSLETEENDNHTFR